MIDERTFLHLPIIFDKNITIYPPTVNDVVSTKEFSLYHKILTCSQEELEDDYTAEGKDISLVPNPYDYLFVIAQQGPAGIELLQQAFNFFIHDTVNFIIDQKLIIIGNLETVMATVKSIEDIPILNKDMYFDFQNAIKLALGEKPNEKPDPNMHPKIKAMRAKARYRDKIKAKSGKGINFASTLISLCCMGIGITPLNIGEISYAAISPLVHYWQEKDQYETAIRSLQAGASPKKVKPKYWIRNIEE